MTSVVHQRQDFGSPWNHPHVITSTWVAAGTKFVTLRTCTSFGGQGLGAKKAHHQHYFLEADESQLTAMSGKFNKQTYVNCSPGHEFTIEFQYLQPWPGSNNKVVQFSEAAVDSMSA
jgi:hypothetical protein